MKIRFLGANQQVTGSCTMLELAGKRVMIDCGLFQEPQYEARNHEPWPIPPAEIDLLLLTHAHLDHCGRIPRLLRDGFAGPIFATAPTIELTQLVLEDAAHVQEDHDGPPLLRAHEVEHVITRMKPVEYWKPLHFDTDLAFRFRDAGHILGSAIIEIAAREGQIARGLTFSGDLGQPDRPLVRDPADTVAQVDYLVMESTYGDSDHEHEPIEDCLTNIIQRVATSGGKLLIPTFAIERAQELLYYLSRLAHAGRIPRVPTFLDSPLAVQATRVFAHHRQVLDEQTQSILRTGDSVLDFPGLELVVDSQDSRAIGEIEGPAIIIAGSGMCTGGRILNHLA